MAAVCDVTDAASTEAALAQAAPGQSAAKSGDLRYFRAGLLENWGGKVCVDRTWECLKESPGFRLRLYPGYVCFWMGGLS